MSQLVRRIYFLVFFATLSNATMLVAQTTHIYRPSAYKDVYANPTYAFDGNSATKSDGNAEGLNGNHAEDEQWYGFSAVNGTPTSIKLKITSQLGGQSPCTGLLAYATDGGGNPLTYHYFYSSINTRSQQTDQAVLSNSQDLTKMLVRGEVDCPIGAHAGIGQEIFEIWIEVTTE